MYVYIPPPITLSSHFHQLSPVHTYIYPLPSEHIPHPLYPTFTPHNECACSAFA